MEQPYERLRHARKAAGYKSASAAARANGWNESAYRHHENGTRGYGIEQAVAYAEAFSVAPTWLLTLGFSADGSWRLPIGKFFVEALHSQLTWKPGLEETVNNAFESLGLCFVPELEVTVNSIDPVRGHDDYPRFHFVDPQVVQVDTDRFKSGFMFLMHAPRSVARSIVAKGDLILIDSGEGEVKTHPQLWVIRTFGEILVGWAQRQDETIVFLPDTVGAAPLSIDPEPNIVGRVRWTSRSV